MHQGIVDWVRASALPEMVRGKRILDVGSQYLNGSMRPWFESFDPVEYHGIDVVDGKGVDEVLDVEWLLSTHGPQRWDLILCLEMLEHCLGWQNAIYQMKESLTEGGWLVLTTRSPGYPFHAPPDHWRFPKELLRESFNDLEDVSTWSDPGYAIPSDRGGTYFPQSGVFIRGRRGGQVSIPKGKAEVTLAFEPGTLYVDPMTGEPSVL